MPKVPLEDLPNNLVPSSDMPLELPTINVVPEDDLPDTIKKKTRSVTEQIGRGLSSIARGAAPAVAGAIGGGALAGPAGALAGSLALPAAELLTKSLNLALPDKYDIPSPAAAVEKGLTKLGFPQPENLTERALQAGGSVLGGTGGQVGALSTLAKTAQNPAARGLAETLSQQPVRQLAASVPAGATTQAVTEETGSPTLGLAAGIATGIPFATVGNKVVAPTVQELKGQAGQQYKFAEDAGAVFKGKAYQQFSTSAEDALMKEGLDKTLHPKVYAALQRIKDTKGNVSLEDMNILRRIAQGASSSIDADERRVGSILVNKLDDFVETASPNTLAKGSSEAVTALNDARNLWKRAKKTEILDDIFNSAELRSEANFTQSGMENALRRKLVNLADNKSKMRAFTKEEQNAIQLAAKGGSMQNALRFLGKFAPTGVISGGGAVGLGYWAGGAPGAIALPIIGAAARKGAEQLGLRSFNQLRNKLSLGENPIPQIPVSSVISGRQLATPLINPITGLLTPQD